MNTIRMFYGTLIIFLATFGCAYTALAQSASKDAQESVPVTTFKAEKATVSNGPLVVRFRDAYGQPICSFYGNGSSYQFVGKFGDNVNCPNDKAAAASLTNVTENTVLSVYDSPTCAGSDDNTFILARITTTGILDINNLEREVDDSEKYVTYNRKDGLNGKVSCFKLSVP